MIQQFSADDEDLSLVLPKASTISMASANWSVEAPIQCDGELCRSAAGGLLRYGTLSIQAQGGGISVLDAAMRSSLLTPVPSGHGGPSVTYQVGTS